MSERIEDREVEVERKGAKGEKSSGGVKCGNRANDDVRDEEEDDGMREEENGWTSEENVTGNCANE